MGHPVSGASREFARVRNALEGVSWAAVLICGAVAFDHFHEARVSAQVAEHIAGASGAAVNVPAGHGDGAVIGRLEIPAVRLTVPVMENYDPASLKRGVGHIPGTAMPGGLGNLGLAGHRDTFFRPLRNIRIGMTIDVVTAGGKVCVQDRVDGDRESGQGGCAGYPGPAGAYAGDLLSV